MGTFGLGRPHYIRVRKFNAASWDLVFSFGSVWYFVILLGTDLNDLEGETSHVIITLNPESTGCLARGNGLTRSMTP